ncbi:hypothetical protein GCM10027590_34250 [Nocardiopsis nanhaiensis]
MLYGPSRESWLEGSPGWWWGSGDIASSIAHGGDRRCRFGRIGVPAVGSWYEHTNQGCPHREAVSSAAEKGAKDRHSR